MFIVKVTHKTSELLSQAIIAGLGRYGIRVKTLTYDNGKESEAHIQIDQALQSTGYFARTYTGWERGTNENFNGLLLQYVSKKRSIATDTEEEIKMIEHRLNKRTPKNTWIQNTRRGVLSILKGVALRA